jgi:hypothetical protein
LGGKKEKCWPKPKKKGEKRRKKKKGKEEEKRKEEIHLIPDLIPSRAIVEALISVRPLFLFFFKVSEGRRSRPPPRLLGGGWLRLGPEST